MHDSNKILTSAIQDERLSCTALGLLVRLIHKKQHEHDYSPSMISIAEAENATRDKISKHVRELESLGYLTLRVVRKAGRIVGTEWEITDEPKQ